MQYRPKQKLSNNIDVIDRVGKNLGFWIFLKVFFKFLGFNVHNAEHRYMTHDK